MTYVALAAGLALTGWVWRRRRSTRYVLLAQLWVHDDINNVWMVRSHRIGRPRSWDQAHSEAAKLNTTALGDGSFKERWFVVVPLKEMQHYV